jgi:UDP-glucuronate 4-epimerase
MYLVTGCAGFIGFHMCELLLNKGNKVIGIDNLNKYYSKDLKLKRLSILNKKKLFRFINLDLSKNKIDEILLNNKNLKIIHFAAQPGVIYSYKNPRSYYKNNILATNKLIESVKKKEISQFIFISSSSVYGDQKKYPINEDAKLKSINYYAETKIYCEKQIRKHFNKCSHSTKILRPFTVYGPYGRPDMLILKMLTLIKKKKKVDIFNHGKHLRDFTYVEDVVKIIFHLANKKNKKIKTFNICASNPIEINKIIKIFENFLNKKILINKLPKRQGEMKITYGSNKYLLKFINFKNFTSINHGLRKTINWYKKFKYKKLLELHK